MKSTIHTDAIKNQVNEYESNYIYKSRFYINMQETNKIKYISSIKNSMNFKFSLLSFEASLDILNYSLSNYSHDDQ